MNFMFFSPLEQFEILVLTPIFTESVFGTPTFLLDISVTNATIYLIFIVSTIVKILEFSLYEVRVISHKWFNAVEFLYGFVNSLIRQQTGSARYEYAPIFFTTFLFILGSNLVGLLPFGYTMTGQILVTFTLAFSFNFGFFILGWQKQGFSFLRLFVPKNAPALFKPLIAVIEVVSYLLRTFSLSIRLFANMMAGHTLLHILSSFCFVSGVAFSLIPWLLVFAVVVLEFAIAFIQAYVFVILLTIYLNDAVNSHAH